MSNFDLNAKFYAEHNQPQVQRALDLLNQFPISDNSNILHIRSRDAQITAHLASHHTSSTFHAVDPSPDMHAYAQKHHPLENIHYHLSEINHFSPTTQFDHILCFSALYYIQDQDALFKNLKSWLKPSGSITILTYGYHEPFWLPASQAVENHPTWSKNIPTDFTPYTFHPKDHYLDLFKQNNLTPSHFDVSPQTANFPSLEHFLDYVQGYHPHTKFVPKEDIPEFRSLTADIFLKNFAPSHNPPFDLPFDLWQIHLKNS